MMRIVDAQIHLWGSGLASNMAHRQVTSFTPEEALGLMAAVRDDVHRGAPLVARA
jgi:hypothetical protein